MTLTRITSLAVTALPFIAIALALANWYAQPERGLAWLAAIVVSVVMVIVRHLSQVAVRRSSGDALAARNFASVTGAVAFGALMLVIPLSVTLAQALGVGVDPDSLLRTIMIVTGLYLAAAGNAMPRLLPPVSTLQGDAARVQAFQRLAGWTWVLCGLGFATAWLVLPIDVAGPVSVVLVAAALIVTIVQILRLRKPQQGAPGLS